MKQKKLGSLRKATLFAALTWTCIAGAQAASLPRSSVDVYQDMRAWIKEHGESHVYPGPRFGDDFFCFDPAKCRDPIGTEDPVNPVMDHLAALADEFIVRTFQETLGSNQTIFRGTTTRGEPCEVDLKGLRIFAEIGGDPYDDYFRADWNEDGYWWRFKILEVAPGQLEMVSQPDALTRATQRLFSPRHSGEQHFEMKRLGEAGLQVSMWVNTSEAEHVLDWRRRRVVCRF